MTAQSTIPTSMWFAALVVASQSFMFGYVFSCLNACLVTGDNNSGSDCFHGTDSSCPDGTIYNDINLSTIEASLATSLTLIGAWIGSLAGGMPSQKYGKRMTLLFNTSFFIVGAVISALGNLYCLFIGRFISGIGVGVASGVPSVLLAEIASTETRGTITTLHQLAVTCGIFFASLLGYGLVTYVNHGWQYIQGLGCIPGIFLLIVKNHLPESPKWLLMQSSTVKQADTLSSIHGLGGNLEASMGSNTGVNAVYSNDQYATVSAQLRRIRAEGHDVDGEIATLLDDVKQEAATTAEGGEVSCNEVLSYKTGMVVGVGLMFFQAITGINSVMFYSTTIFSLSGFDQSIIGTTCVGVLNVFMTLVAAYIIDRTGRKILLLSGTYTMLAALLILSIVLLSPIPSTTQGVIAVLAVLLFVAGFAIGLGAVCWTVMSEIMPNRLRIKAVSLFLSVNWGSNLIIGLLTLTAIDGLGGVKSSMDDDETAVAEKKGVAYLYLIFAAFTVVALVFMHAYVPETKGTRPEDHK